MAKGKIIACANAGTLKCESEKGIGGISSYSAGIIYSCYSKEPPVSEQFMGEVYRSDQEQEVFPGIADESLVDAQQVFMNDLKGLNLLNYGTETDTEQDDN